MIKKVFIYPDDDVLYAIADTGSVLAEEEITCTDKGRFFDEDVLPLRDRLRPLLGPDCVFVFVGADHIDVHPELQAILKAGELADELNDHSEEDLSNPDCSVCVHGATCRLPPALIELGADLAFCPHYVPMPEPT